MTPEKILDYLQRKTADTHELQAASLIIGLQSRIAELELEFNQASGLLDDALRSIEILENQLTTEQARVKELVEIFQYCSSC